MSKYKLVIVESPHKAKTIKKYLGDGWVVTASCGHILDLPKKEIGIDPVTFKCDLVTIPGKEDVIKQILQLSKDASEIYLASDPDREGEAIAAHLSLKIKRKDVKRALFHEITKPAILEAIKNSKEIDSDKYDAQQARRIIDRLVGYKVSPVLWDKLQSGLSAGRVQSVALRVIVIREREIRNFTAEKWFEILAPFDKEKIDFTAKYVGPTPLKTVKLKDKAEVDQILSDIKGKQFEITDIEKKDKISNPQPPYTTSKLQQEASSKLKMKSKDTMAFAQKLYEAGHITYMRTDSVRTEPESLRKLRELISKDYGDKYLSKEPIIHKQKKTDSKVQDAHEAIRPTSLDNNPSKLKAGLNGGEYDLYKLIWDKFVASQMASSLSEVSTVTMVVDKCFFKASGSVLVFDGFKKVSMGLEDSSDSDNALPRLEVGEKLSPTKEPYAVSKESSPPARYLEGGLIKELEEKGVGRPSTYAAIIENILYKNYVEKGKDERFIPTDVGDKLCTFLEKHFPVHVDIGFTAKTEETLDDIEEGKVGYKKILATFLEGLEKEILGTKDIPSIAREGGKEFPKKLTEHLCRNCGKQMCLIEIKDKDKFLSCSDYPQCKTSMPVPSKIKCPKCSKGTLSERKTKAGDPFVGCSTYPSKECGFVAWSSKLIKCKHCPCNIITKNKEGDKVCYDCKKGQSTNRVNRKEDKTK